MLSRRPKRRKVWIRWPIWAAFGLLLFVAGGGFLTAAHLEENDAFCAACHSEPESSYYQRTRAATAADLASRHATPNLATRCIDCHSGPGTAGRVSAMALGARDLAAFMTHTDTQPAPLTVPVGDANCLKCHAGVPATNAFNLHFHAYLGRWQAIDPHAATCVDCHAAHTTDGDAGTGYLNQTRTDQVCERCHAARGASGEKTDMAFITHWELVTSNWLGLPAKE